jgi:hypothetical protein
MKSIDIKISFIALLLVLVGIGCSDEELPPFQAKGRIIEITGGCYSEIVLIEVSNPKGIGESGSFARIGEDEKRVNYRNAIAVPYFSKIGIPNSVPQKVGTWLYFEYREFTEEEIASQLFLPNPPMMCYGNIGPPSSKRLIITKVIDFSPSPE